MNEYASDGSLAGLGAAGWMSDLSSERSMLRCLCFLFLRDLECSAIEGGSIRSCSGSCIEGTVYSI